jgi:hypothetical protein
VIFSIILFIIGLMLVLIFWVCCQVLLLALRLVLWALTSRRRATALPTNVIRFPRRRA